MLNLIYLGIVLIVAFISIATGFRRGLTGQIASVLGFAFGAVAARVLTPEFSSKFTWVLPFTPAPEFNEFAVNLVCSVTIYFVVYWIFSIFSSILNGALSVFNVGMFNRLLGAFFSLLKNLMWLSIIFNLMLCFRPESELLLYERADDGNLVASVMDISPAVLGSYGARDFAHFHQLKEAKAISCNFHRTQYVIIENETLINLLQC